MSWDDSSEKVRFVEQQILATTPLLTALSSYTGIFRQIFFNVIEQAPYSPAMAPCDFFLFHRLKLTHRGKRFESVEIIKQYSLKTIPKSAYNKCYDEWIIRWRKCIASNGAYVEGDKINSDY